MSNPRRLRQPSSLGTPQPDQPPPHVFGSPDADWANALKREHPDLSAATPMVTWQKRALAAVLSAGVAGLLTSPEATAAVAMALLTPAFLCLAILRAYAIAGVVADPPNAHIESPSAISSADLPMYSILVPLYGEAHMAAALVASLDRLDWPVAKRDIVFITEADDAATRRALQEEIQNRPDMRILTVPQGWPRTKPRALMYALPFARGAFVVVFDAEDEPEPDQLRKSFHHFAGAAPEIGCLQAHLNIYNARQSWITRQFTLEYTALFDAILPAIQRLAIPMPLGGTSNHFRREALERSGGWDPYNVTEDADLGIRLARQGWRVEMLGSTTWEEAPADTKTWLGQRARWLKGWMQTSLVHLRDPAKLWRELGPRGFFGFNVLLGGVIISALIHPMVYGYALWKLAAGDLSLWPPDGWPAVVWWMGVANLAFAYIVGIALTVLAAWRRHDARLAAHALLLPVYWLMISLAAYRALADLIRSPFHWRKTTHAGRRAD